MAAGDVDYKAFKNGANFLDWVGMKSAVFRARNTRNQAVWFKYNGGASAISKAVLLENNAATSGVSDVGAFLFTTNGYMFNSTITIKANVFGEPGTYATTAITTETWTLSLEANKATIPSINAIDKTVILTASSSRAEASWDAIYYVEYTAVASNGKVVTLQNVGIGGVMNNLVNALEFPNLGDVFGNDSGSVTITATVKSINENYDANVTASITLLYNQSIYVVGDTYYFELTELDRVSRAITGDTIEPIGTGEQIYNGLVATVNDTQSLTPAIEYQKTLTPFTVYQYGGEVDYVLATDTLTFNFYYLGTPGVVRYSEVIKGQVQIDFTTSTLGMPSETTPTTMTWRLRIRRLSQGESPF